MLLQHIMKASDFLGAVVPETGNFNDFFDMCLVNQTGLVVPIL